MLICWMVHKTHSDHKSSHGSEGMNTLTLTPYVHRYITGRVRRGELAELTGRAYRLKLMGLAESHGRYSVEQLGPKAIDRWLERIGHLAPATRRDYLSIVRGFCRWLAAEGKISGDITAHVPLIEQPRRAPKTLTVAEVGRLLMYVRNDPRSTLIVWLMVGLGLRCCEVSRLRVEDYDPGRNGQGVVRVIGKAKHERVLPVVGAVTPALDSYLDTVGCTGGPLIRTIGGRDPLAPHTISKYMRRWMYGAGVKVRAYDGRSAHGLRRTAASDMMDLTGDIRAVQEMLGHSDPETTIRYYLRLVSMQRLRESMEGRDYPMPDVHERRAS